MVSTASSQTIMEYQAIAIIPARGGSKRIPRKNIKLFAGKPIIEYSIEAAFASNCFDTVMVSTEDEEITHIARRCGAEVPFIRSKKNADDWSMLADVIREVLLEYESIGKRTKYFCCLLPTAPLVLSQRIVEAFEKMKVSDADCVMTVTAFSYPIQRASRILDNGQLTMFYPENYNVRSQDLVPSYHDAGQFYWMKSASLLEQMRLYAKHTVPLVLPEMEVQDIDSEEDWQLAELKYKLMRSLV